MALAQSDLKIVISAANNSQAAFAQLNQSLNSLKNLAIGAGTALAGAFALRDVVDSTRRLGNEIDLLRDNLGLSAEEASRLNYAARVVGSSAEEVSQSFGSLNRKLIEQIPLIAKGESDFHKWGVAVQDATGDILPFTQVFENVRKRLSELPAGFERSGLAMDLMGRSGRELIDLMTLTDAQFADLAREAEEMGLILSEAGVDSLEQFNRNLNRLDLQMDAIKLQIGSFLVPLLGKVLGAFRAAAGAAKAFGEALRTPLGILKEVAARIGSFIAQIKEQGFLNAVANLARDLVSKVGEALGGVGAWLAESWPKWRIGLGQLFDNAVTWIRTIGWPSIVNFIETKVPEFANWIVQSLPEWTKNAGALISDFVQWWVSTGVPTILEGFGTATAKIGEWLLNAIGWMSHIGIPAAQSTLLAIGGAVLKGIVEGLGDLKTKIWNWIKEAIPMAADIEAFLRSKFPGAAAPAAPATPGSSGQSGLGPGGSSGGGAGGGGGKSWAPSSPAATLDDIYANYMNKYGVMPEYSKAMELLNEGLTYRQVSQGIGLADGGIVKARPGGTLARIGEGGQDEAVIPLSKMGGAGGVTVNVNVGTVDSQERVRELANAVSAEIMRAMSGSGNIWRRGHA